MTDQNIITTVGTLSDIDIINLCLEGELIVENFSKKNVHQSCYELRASSVYYDIANNNKKYTLSANEFILIKPRQLVVVITMEKLELPHDILARILTKGKLFSIGLLPVNTYADPGFDGYLGIVLNNLSNNYLKIFPEESIAKMEFSRLMVPVERAYRGQHGYQTEIWPVPKDMILSPQEIRNDPRIKSPTEEIILAYGSNIGKVIDRVFRFERALILTAVFYILFSMIIIYAMQGSDWITPTTGIILGVASNVFTSLLVYGATNIRRLDGN
jgi:dCTP deaminase